MSSHLKKLCGRTANNTSRSHNSVAQSYILLVTIHNMDVCCWHSMRLLSPFDPTVSLPTSSTCAYSASLYRHHRVSAIVRNARAFEPCLDISTSPRAVCIVPHGGGCSYMASTFRRYSRCYQLPDESSNKPLSVNICFGPSFEPLLQVVSPKSFTI